MLHSSHTHTEIHKSIFFSAPMSFQCPFQLPPSCQSVLLFISITYVHPLSKAEWPTYFILFIVHFHIELVVEEVKILKSAAWLNPQTLCGYCVIKQIVWEIPTKSPQNGKLHRCLCEFHGDIIRSRAGSSHVGALGVGAGERYPSSRWHPRQWPSKSLPWLGAKIVSPMCRDQRR